jgi:hypothetical protein
MGQVHDFKSLVQLLLGLLKLLVPLIIGLAMVLFLFGIVRYITAGQDENRMKEGRNLMIYGIIALFVMVSVWGLVAILTSTIFGGALNLPQVQ